MSQNIPFSDEPLPGLEPEAKLPEANPAEPVSTAGAGPDQLHDPDLKPAGSYGRSDPASLAAVSSLDLQNPDLHDAQQPDLPHASLAPNPEESAPVAAPLATPPATDFSNWDPHLAHLAQVGLIAADHWEEQIKPRIDQLHEDIEQVHEQLNDLEHARRQTKKS